MKECEADEDSSRLRVAAMQSAWRSWNLVPSYWKAVLECGCTVEDGRVARTRRRDSVRRKAAHRRPVCELRNPRSPSSAPDLRRRLVLIRRRG
jgi:hypothetical protein